MNGPGNERRTQRVHTTRGWQLVMESGDFVMWWWAGLITPLVVAWLPVPWWLAVPAAAVGVAALAHMFVAFSPLLASVAITTGGVEVYDRRGRWDVRRGDARRLLIREGHTDSWWCWVELARPVNVVRRGPRLPGRGRVGGRGGLVRVDAFGCSHLPPGIVPAEVRRAAQELGVEIDMEGVFVPVAGPGDESRLPLPGLGGGSYRPTGR